jgi:hypothetical protein
MYGLRLRLFALTYSQESLASSFEGMNLFEEAIVPYDELEALFYRVSKEKNMSWFGSLINADATDDSSSFLTTERKAYRDLILANTISVFDFRIYLLARQCLLLAKLGRLKEIAAKVGFFLGAFGKRLREIEVSTCLPMSPRLLADFDSRNSLHYLSKHGHTPRL